MVSLRMARSVNIIRIMQTNTPHLVTLTIIYPSGRTSHNPFAYNFAVRLAGYDVFQYASHQVPLEDVAYWCELDNERIMDTL